MKHVCWPVCILPNQQRLSFHQDPFITILSSRPFDPLALTHKPTPNPYHLTPTCYIHNLSTFYFFPLHPSPALLGGEPNRLRSKHSGWGSKRAIFHKKMPCSFLVPFLFWAREPNRLFSSPPALQVSRAVVQPLPPPPPRRRHTTNSPTGRVGSATNTLAGIAPLDTVFPHNHFEIRQNVRRTCRNFLRIFRSFWGEFFGGPEDFVAR